MKAFWFVIAIVLGFIFMVSGSSLVDSLTSDVDVLVTNKWFGGMLVIIGAIGIAVQTKAFSKI